MSTKDKELQRELKQPDQFVSFWTRAGEAASSSWKAIVGGLLALAAVMVGIWIVSNVSDRRSADQSRAFARIERIATAALIPATGEAKFDDDLPHFKTADERLGAAVKEADAFLSANGRSKLKDEALLLKAAYLMALGKASDAAGVYQGLVGSIDDRLRFLARDGLAQAHEALGQVDKAIELYGVLADEGAKAGNFFWDQATYNKARLLAKKGNATEAQKLLKQIVEKEPATPLRSEIDNHLALLEAK